MSDYDALDGTIPDTEESLNIIREHVEQARSMPMSASVMVNKDELLGIIEDALGRDLLVADAAERRSPVVANSRPLLDALLSARQRASRD